MKKILLLMVLVVWGGISCASHDSVNLPHVSAKYLRSNAISDGWDRYGLFLTREEKNAARNAERNNDSYQAEIDETLASLSGGLIAPSPQKKHVGKLASLNIPCTTENHSFGPTAHCTPISDFISQAQANSPVSFASGKNGRFFLPSLSAQSVISFDDTIAEQLLNQRRKNYDRAQTSKKSNEIAQGKIADKAFVYGVLISGGGMTRSDFEEHVRQQLAARNLPVSNN